MEMTKQDYPNIYFELNSSLKYIYSNNKQSDWRNGKLYLPNELAVDVYK